MEHLQLALASLIVTGRDVLPIAVVIFGFQVFVLRRPIRNFRRVAIGFIYVLLGLTLFLLGLEEALFPLGRLMAEQLTSPAFIAGSAAGMFLPHGWGDYAWVYLFAFAIGFATTIAEPSLMAVAIKANDVSAGAIHVWGLRVAVALPPLPAYHSDAMDLEAEIDRGDVWYE